FPHVLLNKHLLYSLYFPLFSRPSPFSFFPFFFVFPNKMASQLPRDSESFTNIGDFEELEITEFHEALLRELLEGPEVGTEDNGFGFTDQSVEAGVKPDSTMEACDYWKQVDTRVDDFDWLEMMKIATAMPCNEPTVGNPGTYMEEMVEMHELGDLEEYSHAYYAVSSDEIAYGGLWQDN
ncbi:unnamed protein product, partial [Ilex paraguariensis]